MQEKISSSHNFAFWFHLFITALAWVAPFLFPWQWVVSVFGIIILQFLVFKRCLLNASHDLNAREDATFYSYLMEACGMQVNHRKVKRFVHDYLYAILGLVALFWQVYLGNKPLLF